MAESIPLGQPLQARFGEQAYGRDRKSTRLNSSHDQISYAVFCLKKKITVRWLLGPSRPHAKGSKRERHDAALAPVPRRVRVTRGFDEIVLLVSAFSELPTRHLFSDAVRWK